jgi:hypothetical protein
MDTSLPRTIGHALNFRWVFDCLHFLPSELTTVFGPPLAVIIRSVDVGIGKIVCGADQNGADGRRDTRDSYRAGSMSLTASLQIPTAPARTHATLDRRATPNGVDNRQQQIEFPIQVAFFVMAGQTGISGLHELKK